MLTFNATGEVQLSTDAADIATRVRLQDGPQGDERAAAQRARGRAHRPHRPERPAVRHRQRRVTFTMPAAGQLFLGVNDDGFDDNQGEFRVDITRTGRR